MPERAAAVWGCMILVWLLLLGNGAQEGHASSPAAPQLARACRFLWQQQSDDGGWHSAIHGLLKSGQALTPFILLALLDSPEAICHRPPQQVTAGLQFLRRHVSATGILGIADPDILEYPNYATAYALQVLVRIGEDADQPLRAKMQQCLVQQRFVESRGVTAADLSYGAWGFGEVHLPPGHTGHVDLSHTRRVLQALRVSGHEEHATYARAQVFLRLLQKHPSEVRLQPDGIAGHPGPVPYDGGFYFSPVVLNANKAGRVPAAAVFRSYATATCDGILALLAAGVAPDDERIAMARQWLQAHPALDYPQGIPLDHPEQWHRVLFYYHLAARAAVYQTLNWPGDWRQTLLALLAARQRPDGSCSNPDGAPNKEDDSLLATALVVETLGYMVRDPTPPR